MDIQNLIDLAQNLAIVALFVLVIFLHRRR